jgi:rhodanese-related sulfurtransferase
MQHLNAAGLKQRLEAGESFRLIDVREADEWAYCRLPRAEWVPLSCFAAEAPQKLGRADDIVLYCHHGVRSMHAGQFLEQLGYTVVTNLDGGIHGWSKEIDPTVPVY